MGGAGGTTGPPGGLVSVGVPTFNRSEPVRRAVHSVLEQSYRPVEVVVSDNASTDDTAAQLAALAGDHPELVILTQTRNVGPTENFRAVAAANSGDYFMWLGDDDWIDGDYVAACLARLASEPAAVMVAGTARYHQPDSNSREPAPVNVDGTDPAGRLLSYFRQVTSNGVFYGVTRRSAFGQLPALPDKMGGDWLHVAALAYLGTVRTLDSVEVHRSVGGATRSLADVARHANLGWFQATAPQLAIAWFVLADIGWRSPVYGDLGPARRVALGARAAAIICRRFVPGAIVKFFRR